MKFQYRIERVANQTDRSTVENLFNVLGSQGWELCFFVDNEEKGWMDFFFKRSL